ncbi:Homeobox protein NANOG, partial [Galemys pyrenaicus]
WIQFVPKVCLNTKYFILGTRHQCLRLTDLKKIMHPCKSIPLRQPHKESVSLLLSSICLFKISLIPPPPQIKPTVYLWREQHSEEGRQGPSQETKGQTEFPQTQLYILASKYFSHQYMEEFSNIKNLGHKQIRTWFQNQRIKHERNFSGTPLKASQCGAIRPQIIQIGTKKPGEPVLEEPD